MVAPIPFTAHSDDHQPNIGAAAPGPARKVSTTGCAHCANPHQQLYAVLTSN